jgi:signal-transduction protein with cAMP-binding, CBS, and nucleotidyltransferase domain
LIAENLIAETLPVMRPGDTGQQALNWMDVYRVSHLPVVKEREYLGLISDKLIYDLNLTEESIDFHTMQLHTPHVHPRQHIFEVASIMYRLNLSVLPVVDDDHNYTGAITLDGLSGRFARLFSLQEPGGIIILQTTWNNYSASQISQIVEGNDARILGLFVNRIEQSDNLEVTIKLDKVDLSSVIQTFTRYDYLISAVYMDDSMLNDMYEDRMEQLLRYMNI